MDNNSDDIPISEFSFKELENGTGDEFIAVSEGKDTFIAFEEKLSVSQEGEDAPSESYNPNRDVGSNLTQEASNTEDESINGELLTSLERPGNQESEATNPTTVKDSHDSEDDTTIEPQDAKFTAIGEDKNSINQEESVGKDDDTSVEKDGVEEEFTGINEVGTEQSVLDNENDKENAETDIDSVLQLKAAILKLKEECESEKVLLRYKEVITSLAFTIGKWVAKNQVDSCQSVAELVNNLLSNYRRKVQIDVVVNDKLATKLENKLNLGKEVLNIVADDNLEEYEYKVNWDNGMAECIHSNTKVEIDTLLDGYFSQINEGGLSGGSKE